MNNIIEIKYLEKKYGKRIIFTNLSFNINEGDFVLIKGRSGCGKTTLLNILSFQDKRYNGSYFFNNQDVKRGNHLSLIKIRNSSIGYVYQDYELIKNKTAKDNILLPYLYNDLKIDFKWYEKIINLLGIKDLEEKEINYLSGGEKQRVSIARAIILKPKVIFLDEPFSNLDITNKKILIDQLNYLSKEENIAVVLVSHDVPDYLNDLLNKSIDMELYGEDSINITKEGNN